MDGGAARPHDDGVPLSGQFLVACDKVVRFEIVDEDEWERRLNGMLAA